MSKVNELFEKELCVVNFGIESFYQDLKKQNVKSVHVAWKPVAGGDKKIAGYLKQLKDPNLAEKIAAANKEALRRILAAQPALVGMSTAGEAKPDTTRTAPAAISLACWPASEVGGHVRSYERRCYGRPDL